MAQQERARRTREKILRAAAETIERVGYPNATLSGIGTAAGTTKGALYFHFASKEAIAHALVDEQHGIATRAAEKTLEKNLPAAESMMVLCRDLAAGLITDAIVRAGVRLTTDSSTFEKPLADPYQDWIGTFEALVLRGIAAGSLKAEIDPAAVARFVVAAFAGVQLVSEALDSRADLLQCVHEMWLLILPGIVPSDQIDDATATARAVFLTPS